MKTVVEQAIPDKPLFSIVPPRIRLNTQSIPVEAPGVG
ncbi:hypothetical protein PAMC26510_26060 [Caballeronia sordidicola]|uniref:Uncharacterized protein n=1 Tax=Caballeronia sordidicola TaxID=196367 RepID=A0A242MFD5_CABSO|nr:hypothetical protein PAMC26510_26060 [Caballeronia sordidicola]